MRFLLVLLAVLSGLVLPQMAGATRVPVAGLGTALHEEQVTAPQQEARLARRAKPLPSYPRFHRTTAPLPAVPVAAANCGIALTDRPLE